MWKFCRNAELPQCFRRFVQNSAEIVLSQKVKWNCGILYYVACSDTHQKFAKKLWIRALNAIKFFCFIKFSFEVTKKKYRAFSKSKEQDFTVVLKLFFFFFFSFFFVLINQKSSPNYVLSINNKVTSDRQNQSSTLLILHKKWSFRLRISSVNVTKSAGNCRFGHIYWRNP